MVNLSVFCNSTKTFSRKWTALQCHEGVSDLATRFGIFAFETSKEMRLDQRARTRISDAVFIQESRPLSSGIEIHVKKKDNSFIQRYEKNEEETLKLREKKNENYKRN